MSRWLVLCAAAGFALVALGPSIAMALRVQGADLAALDLARGAGLLWRTMQLGLGAAAIALCLGAPMGWILARAAVPGAQALRALVLVPLLLPPLVLAMSFMGWTTWRGGLATAAIMGVGTYPLVALYVARAAERIDGRRADAARLAGGLAAMLRVEWALVRPVALASAGFAFAFAVNDFAVVDYVSSLGPKHPVYADDIFASWRSGNDTSKAVAAAWPLVALTLMVVVPALVVVRRSPLFTHEGDFRAPARVDLGAWRWPLALLAWAVVGATALAPLARLAFEAGGGARGFGLSTLLQSLSKALANGRPNLQASLLHALGAALLCLPVALVLGHALARSRRWLVLGTTLVVLPLCVPPILHGVGSLALWNRPATAALYDSGWMAVLLQAGRYAPLFVLGVAAAIAATDRRIEDSARLAGAGPARTLCGIVAPLLAAPLAGGAMVVFVFALRELDAAILVPAANGTALFRLYNAVHFGRDEMVAALALWICFFVLLPGALWSLHSRRNMGALP
ncbi:MAG: ABC transporter permease [Planctomycetia bacterium]